MRKKNYFRKRFIRKSQPKLLGSMLQSFVLSRAKDPEQANLHELWKHWEMVLGDELASLAKPLGSRARTLLIGTSNNLELQEVRMQYDDILARANAFMKAFAHEAYFNKVEFSLFRGKSELDKKIELPSHLNGILPPRPNSDTYKSIDFGDNHALALCYEAYCARLEKEKHEESIARDSI